MSTCNDVPITRRSVLKGAGALAIPSALGRLPATAAPASTRIREVVLDLHHLHKWDQSNGDTWDPFWADDGNLYAFSCDGRGFGTKPRNLAFNRLSGDSPHGLAGAPVNSMDEYGEAGKKEADNATWKVCGQECIDSVFYAFVSRNAYGKDSGDYWLRQTAFNSSLIKSTDRGHTWTRSASANFGNPMWPGPSFGAPMFVHYGKNGGNVAQDEAGRYVYAVSTNGFWNDGDQYVLGRILRTRLGALNASDWSYFVGKGRWAGQIEEAVPILASPTRCGQTPPCYVPALGVYVMVVWYNTERMTTWFEPNEMRYDFYQADHLWGPWTPIDSFSDRFLNGSHMYGPSLCAKFQESSGGEVKIHMFTSGCPFPDVPSAVYKAWTIPVILKTEASPATVLVPSNDARIVYKGNWSAPCGLYADVEARYSASAGDSAQLRFRGAGIAWLADKAAGFGSAEVFLDGKLADTVKLGVDNLPRLSGVTVFRAENLTKAEHTLQIVNRDAAGLVLDSFRIYGGEALPPA
jgi:hypothetical protein